MNIKLTGLVLGTALSALAFTACQTAPVETTNKTNTTKGNEAVIVNNNANGVAANKTIVGTTGNWNANITREEYEKDKANYANKAKETGSTIGSGANDAWLWTKTRAALATTDDLRESTINVDVDNEVVTLKGTVATEAQKTKAATVAKVDGVKSVKNELKVAPADSMTNMSTNSNTSANHNTNTKK